MRLIPVGCMHYIIMHFKPLASPDIGYISFEGTNLGKMPPSIACNIKDYPSSV